jgi:hypothetical protein
MSGKLPILSDALGWLEREAVHVRRAAVTFPILVLDSAETIVASVGAARSLEVIQLDVWLGSQSPMGSLQQAVAASGLKPEQIDTVFLTGGTSRIPLIRTLFADRFGRDKLEQRDAFTSVVHGLGSSVPLFV